MRGTVLQFDSRTGSGLISGDDGARYAFKGVDVQGDFARIREGASVDFQQNAGEAIAIFPVAGQSGQGGEKSKIAAGLLAIFLGSLGVHKFYLGTTGAGIIMLLCSLFGWVLLFVPNIIIGIIALIEGILYLTKSDEDFYQTYEANKKPWF